MSVFLEVSGLILEYLTQGETPGAVDQGSRGLITLYNLDIGKCYLVFSFQNQDFKESLSLQQVVTREIFMPWRTQLFHNVSKPQIDRSEV